MVPLLNSSKGPPMIILEAQKPVPQSSNCSTCPCYFHFIILQAPLQHLLHHNHYTPYQSLPVPLHEHMSHTCDASQPSPVPHLSQCSVQVNNAHAEYWQRKPLRVTFLRDAPEDQELHRWDSQGMEYVQQQMNPVQYVPQQTLAPCFPFNCC